MQSCFGILPLHLAFLFCADSKMKILKRIIIIQNQTGFNKLFSTKHPPKPHFHKQQNPNQTLKNYLNSSSSTKALLLFANLLKKHSSLIDSHTFLYIIKACTKKALVTEGKQIHCIAIKLGYEPSIFIRTSLIDMYSSWGNLYDAHKVFDEIPIKNVVCWTALISAYVDNKKARKGIELFREMVVGNVVPDQVTFTVALSACADHGDLDMGEWVRDCIRKQGLSLDLYLENALLNMYAKCGHIGMAKVLFSSMVKKDVTTWTSMIVGCALHGQAEEALRLYAQMTADCRDVKSNMKKRGNVGRSIVPNDITFIGVLMACSHAGLVEEGKRHFKSITDVYGLKVQPSHYGCMVDLLCRAGLLQEAYDFVMAMPKQPNAVVWQTLLSACSSSGNVELAAKAHRHLLTLNKGLASDDVAMSNAYAVTEMWDEKIIIRDQAKQRKAPAHSSVWHQ